MTSSNFPPNGRVLWCLRRTKTDVKCVIRGASVPVALGWARSYELRLRQQGWNDSPVSKAS